MTIFEGYLLIFKIRNDRVVENILLEKLSHMTYENSIIFKHFVRSDNKEEFYYKKHY